jgi:hypothetical protein
VLGVFSNHITIKKILVTDGCATITIDSSGKGNYHFWKKSEDSTGTSMLDLQKIILKNVYVRYDDIKGNKNYRLLADDGSLSLKFQGEQFTLTSKAAMAVDQIRVNGRNYVEHQHVDLDCSMSVNGKTGVYKFDDSRIKVGGVGFTLTGELTDGNELMMDLAVKSETADLKKLMAVLPAEFSKSIMKYNSKGQFTFVSTIRGEIDHRKSPRVTMQFSLRNASISAAGAEIEKINLSGKYEYSSVTKKAMLEIPALTAYLSGHKIEASMRLDDMPDAYITLNAKTQLDLKELLPFIHSDTLESLSGDLAMNVSYAGKVKELSALHKGELYKITASGDVDISNVTFRLKKNPLAFTGMSGSFSLHNNDVYIKSFTGKISSTDFHMDGVFRNFISFLLIPGQPGDMKASVTSSNVDLDELLVNKSAANTSDTTYLMRFNPRLICNLNVNIGKLNFRRFSAAMISGKVNLDRQVISGDNLQFQSMGGNFVMDGTINAIRRDSLTMNYDAKFSNVDITRMFYELENFDQQTMTDKNVKGTVSADVQFASTWSKDLTLNSRSVRSTAAITIENGELNNFQPMNALAKYIHASDLNHVRFSTLKNNISISGRKIYIPHMDINSSALNISANGTHDFDNNVDYHLRLLLSDVLGKKVKSNVTEFGEVEDDGLGHTKLFLSMKGPVTDPDFSYDRKAAGEKLKNDLAAERQNLKNLFSREFGADKNHSSVQAPKSKKREEMQIDWGTE